MKEILILGTGCAKCNKLYDAAKEAVESLGMEHSLKKVTDIREIMKHGIAMTPALVIDGVVKAVGKVPSVEEIKNMLK